jgi:hypothetical protein
MELCRDFALVKSQLKVNTRKVFEDFTFKQQHQKDEH